MSDDYYGTLTKPPVGGRAAGDGFTGNAGVRLGGRDYLQGTPPVIEPQTTGADVAYMMQKLAEGYLEDIRRELLKTHPSVLAVTKVDITNGNNGQSIINDTKPHRIWFEVGGKPTTVYKIILFNNTNTNFIGWSVGPMAAYTDGFGVFNTQPPVVLNAVVDQLWIASITGKTIGVNTPSNLAADGSVFAYGFTIPDYIRKQDYGEQF